MALFQEDDYSDMEDYHKNNWTEDQARIAEERIIEENRKNSKRYRHEPERQEEDHKINSKARESTIINAFEP